MFGDHGVGALGHDEYLVVGERDRHRLATADPCEPDRHFRVGLGALIDDVADEDLASADLRPDFHVGDRQLPHRQT